jgi:hypothetical protein
MRFSSVDPKQLRARWLRYARRTWGRPEMKHEQRHVREALVVAEGLKGGMRDVFLLGCGAADGGVDVCHEALTCVDLSFTSPFVEAQRLRSRVMVVHGADDDVVAPTQAEAIRRVVAPHAPVEVHVTGLYGHTGAQRPGLRGVAHELRTLGRVLSGFADAGTVRVGR